MKINHKIIIILTVLFLGASIIHTQAGCYPYEAKIDSIENAKDCLSIEVVNSCGGCVAKITNNCSGEFYLYDENGSLDEDTVITSGEKYWGHQSLLVGFDGCYESPQEIIIDGKNVCDKDNLKSGDVVKYWTVKIFSKEDNQDIIITGRTVYKAPPERSSNEDLSYLPAIFITILLFAISAILLSKAKKHVGLKRNISIVIAMTLIFSGLYFSFLIIVSTFFSHFIRN